MSLLSAFSIINRTSDKFEVFNDSLSSNNLRRDLDVEDLCNLIFNLLVLSRWPFISLKPLPVILALFLFSTVRDKVEEYRIGK